MRIAILTLRFHTNFGGILQAYALQTVLERMGHQVTVLDKIRKKPQVDIPFIVKIKRVILKYILFQHIQDSPQIFAYKIECAQNKNTWVFVDKYLHRRGINNYNEIKETDYDAFVVGSDQVWRPKYFAGNTPSNPTIANAFLTFAKEWNIKRIAYASSFGTKEWEYTIEETAECKKLINLFDFVSVRETDGKILLENYLDYKDCLVTTDPTTFLSEKDYMYLVRRRFHSKREKGILVYIIDQSENKLRLVNDMATQLELPTFNVNSRVEDESVEDKSGLVQPSVEKWISGFNDAEFIVTDSYHGCIFSILFGKPFIVHVNEQRGSSRFYSLLKPLGLEDRMVFDSALCSVCNIQSDVLQARKLLRDVADRDLQLLQQAINGK